VSGFAASLPGVRIITEASANTATIASSSIEPYPIGRTSASFCTCLLVVPLDTIEWKPLQAPHAIVMNKNGKSHAPVASVKPLNAGHSMASSPVEDQPPTSVPATPNTSAAYKNVAPIRPRGCKSNHIGVMLAIKPYTRST